MGGKIETGETPHQALVREMQKELNAKITVGDLIETIENDDPKIYLSMNYFWCEIVARELKFMENENSKRLSKTELSSVQCFLLILTLLRRSRKR